MPIKLSWQQWEFIRIMWNEKYREEFRCVEEQGKPSIAIYKKALNIWFDICHHIAAISIEIA